MAKTNKKPSMPTMPAKPTMKPTPTRPKSRTDFGPVGSKNADVYPFKKAVPEGFDFRAHKSLKKRDFALDHLFYEYRAAEMDFKAAAFRKQAEEIKKLGSAKDRGRAKRLVKLQEKMAELRKQLEEQGINVNELLATATVE